MTSTAEGRPDLVEGDEIVGMPSRRRRHRVTAVVIAHDGERWLPRVLAALGSAQRRADRVVAVDTGSRDSTARLLADSPVVDDVVTCAPETRFSDAAAAGADSVLDLTDGPDDATIDLRDGRGRRKDSGPVVEWLWFLHDDSAPADSALAELLRQADRVPDAELIGPKLRGWRRADVLQECGLALSRTGRPETGVSSGDVDQGQLDGRLDVMAVSSAGMLITRDLWDRLGGFSRAFGDGGADTDLCWRARRGGARVVVAPRAVVHHRRSAAREREFTGRRGTVRYRHRRTAVTTALVHAPLWRLPFTALRVALGGILRFLLGMVTLSPRRAWDDAAGALMGLTSWRRVAVARRGVARTAQVRERELAHLRPSLAQRLVHLSDVVARPTADHDLPVRGARVAHMGRLMVGVGTVLALVCLVASWELWFGSGRLAGGALLPAPDSGWDLVGSFLSGWHEVGLGSDVAAPAYLAILAALSTLVLGSATLIVQVLLLAAPVLAGLSMVVALRGVVRRPVLPAAGLAYALLPATVVAVDSGRLGSTVGAVVLPLAVRQVMRVASVGTALPPPSPRTTVAAVVLLAVLGAFVPALAITLVVAAAVAAAVGRRFGVVARLAGMSAIAVALLWPWSGSLLTDPARLLLEIGAQSVRTVDAATVWQLALLDPGGPAAPPTFLAAGLVALALLALIPSGTRRSVVGAWCVIFAGLLLAVAQSVAVVGVPWSAVPVRPWPGPGTLLMGLGAVVAVSVAASGLRLHRFSGRVVLVLVLLTPVVLGGWWMAAGPSVVKREDPVVISPFVSVTSVGPEAPRSLALQQRPDGTLVYRLMSGVGPRLGDADMAPALETMASFDSAVSRMTAGSGEALAEVSRAAVRYLTVDVVRDRSLARQLDAVPGLRRVSTIEGQGLWEVLQSVPRVRAVTSDGSVLVPTDILGSTLTAGGPLPTGATVVQVGDAPSSLWQATLDGRALEVNPDRWQTFTVPEGAAGELSVGIDSMPRMVQLTVPLLGLLLLAGWGARSRRPRRNRAHEISEPAAEPAVETAEVPA